ncbi:hypothetical protein GCM10009116_04970 [Brevundimonas basaltis]|uniref:Uncharacterized protein n=1 Tax=Brevundimonas basaltis TaxID=472166 RepID=A0A7W8HZG4_9CAUL|nr:hypothetical protein [Brevundimonas basaltis]MBB5292766.1 hypothetical protein [Brevundimonas basaltis]
MPEFRLGPPGWLPWLGPLVAAGIGAAVGEYGLDGDFGTVLAAALIGGFLPILGNALWRWTHRRKG